MHAEVTDRFGHRLAGSVALEQTVRQMSLQCPMCARRHAGSVPGIFAPNCRFSRLGHVLADRLSRWQVPGRRVQRAHRYGNAGRCACACGGALRHAAMRLVAGGHINPVRVPLIRDRHGAELGPRNRARDAYECERPQRRARLHGSPLRKAILHDAPLLAGPLVGNTQKPLTILGLGRSCGTPVGGAPRTSSAGRRA